MLEKGQVEIKLFNNQYSQKHSFDSHRKRQTILSRESWFTSNLQILYGLGKRLNVGAEVNYRKVQIGASSPFFFSESATSRNAVSTVGPKIKVAPKRSWNHFTVQSGVLFPLHDDLERDPWLEYQAVVWVSQAFWDHYLGTRWLLFAEFDVWTRFGKNVETPLKAIFTYMPSSKLSFYALGDFTRDWDVWPSYYIQTGLGIKYQLLSNFELECLYTQFVAGKGRGAGQSFNIGLRYLR